MQVIDLTHLVTNAMPVFPGSQPVVIRSLSSLDSKGYNELHLSLTTHTGTHIDCGYHLLPEGFETAHTMPERFMGTGMVVDCTILKPGEFITRNFLRNYEDRLALSDFVLFHTGWDQYWGDTRYVAGFPCPDVEAASYLAGFSLKGAGIDAISFDRVESHDLQAHYALLSKGIILVENLTNLESLPAWDFTFCCFPLKLEQGDGSPVRAVGIVKSEK